MLAQERDLGEIVEREQVGAQPVVDVVGVIGDVVGDRGDLRLGAGEAPQLEVLQPAVVEDRLRHAALAVAPDRLCRARSVSGPLCLTRPSSVSQVRLSPSKAA